MSNAALNWAFRLQGLRAATKAVLIALADHAGDDGDCYPSLGRLMQWTALSERAVRGALRELEAAGLLATTHKEGHRSAYILALSTPAPAAPPAGNAPGRKCPPPRQERPDTPAAGAATPAAGAPKPSLTPIEPPGNPQSARARGSRLPADWSPSPECITFAEGLGLNASRIAFGFRDYWHAKAGQGGTKLDWPATWRNWCRREAERQPAQRQEFRNGFLEIIRREREGEAPPMIDDNPFLRLPHVH